MALSLLLSGEEVNKISYIRSFGERHLSRTKFVFRKTKQNCIPAAKVFENG
jgi:hypothetical protein